VPLSFFSRRLLSRTSFDASRAEQLKAASAGATLVYVMPKASFLDYLLMKELALQLDLPSPVYANDLPLASFKMLFQRSIHRHRKETRKLMRGIGAGRSVLLFLGKPGLFAKPMRWNILIWEELLRNRRKNKTKVILAPFTFVWGRRPDRVQRTATDILLGDLSAPGWIRKLFILLKGKNDVRITFGETIDIDRFLNKSADTEEQLQAKRLRRLLSSYLYRERKLITGPPLRDRDRIIRVILRDPDLKPIVDGVSRREKKSPEQIWMRAEKLLRELVSAYNQTLVAWSHKGFRWIWSRLYKDFDVDLEGLNRLKEITKNYPTILIPSHKSHMDYMLLSAIFYENDMMPPHIAAGVNLSFWPMGVIFRANGAFFIRRRISGDLLYARLLYLYIRWLIRTGYSQEFFIEGGRTRTGKLIFPKHGLLSMQVDAFLSGASKELYVIPISVTYERIPEEASYQAELSGEEKRKESIWAVLKSRKLLRRTHGSAYVRFGEPISLRKYFIEALGEKIPTKQRKARTMELAHDVIRSIASQTVITGSSLGALTLLSQSERGITESNLRHRIAWLWKFALEKKIPLSPHLKNMDDPVAWTIDFFLTNFWVEVSEGDEKDRLLLIREDKRIALDFYKNTILHYFLAPAFVALTENKSEMSFLRDLFAHEFVFRKEEDEKFFLHEGRQWMNHEDEPSERKMFAGMIRNYLEAYDLTARAVIEFDLNRSPIGPNDIRKVLIYGQRLLATGLLSRREAITSANVKSAHDYFHLRGMLVNRPTMALWQKQLEKLLKF
jgi:glycerol-3-phosphate O-acyltransferase